MYFRLNPECYLIKGKCGGAIYDLIDGNIYTLEPPERQILENCEKNEIVDKEELLDDLKERCLGNYYEKKIYVEKLRVGSPIEEEQPGHPPKLNRVFLEINNSCQRNCWFCGYNGIKRSLGCMGCNKWRDEEEPLSIERLEDLLDELEDLSCKDIFLTGGDLTLAWEKVLRVLNYAEGKFKKIYMILHQESLSKERIEEVRGKTHLIVQTSSPASIDYESDEFTYIVPIEPEKFESLKLRNKGVMVDFVSKDFTGLPSDLPLVSKKKVRKANLYRFSHNLKYHPCLGGTLAISYGGRVLPCPLLRNHSFGSIKNKELYRIFENERREIEKYWHLTLDKIERCKNCEFRYVCNDCRALEEKLTGKLDGKGLGNYDPEKGKWL